jgi:hypothetical protein
MCKVLVPFTDPDSGERAIRRLLGEQPREPLDVELLAIAAPPQFHNARGFVSRAGAEAAARAAAACWLARLTPMLQAAHVPYSTRVVVGEPLVEVEVALHRPDVDRIVVPADAPHWPTASAPATVVA